LRAAAEALSQSLPHDASLTAIAHASLNEHCAAPVRAAVVATSAADLKAKLARLAERLTDPRCKAIRDPQGIFWFAAPPAQAGKIAFLFPGEGSQYPGMLAGLYPHFPEIREALDAANRSYEQRHGGILPADFLFPEPLANSSDRERWRELLWSLNGAVTAVLAGNFGLLRLLSATGLRPDGVLGHSTGEFTALVAAGVIPLGSSNQQERFSNALWDVFANMPPARPDADHLLAAIGTDASRVKAAIEAAGGGALMAMDNCSLQTVISGPREVVEALVTTAPGGEGLEWHPPMVISQE
jgi:acyl transferase domain-containing protein